MIYLAPKLKLEHAGARPDIGAMVSYRPGNREDMGAYLGRTRWAADNGCFKNPDLDLADYLRWLELKTPYAGACLFVTAPDVVGDSRATWERSEPVLPQIRALGFPAALVAQDGIEDRPVRWDAFDCLFIGGTTEWKLSAGARWMMREAKREGKHVHMGRVNSRRRLRLAAQSGCDSADGTHLAFRPDRYSAQMRRWLDELKRQPFMFAAGDEFDEQMDCWEWALV